MMRLRLGRTARSALVAGLLGAMVPMAASAHPLGNFTVNHYAGVRIASDRVSVDLVIDMAEIPTLDEVAVLDTDGSGSVSPAELASSRESSCRALVSQVRLSVDGELAALGLDAAGLQLRPGSAGLDTLRLVCEVSGPAALHGGSVVSFSDLSYAERIGWREILVIGDGVSVASDAGSVDVTARLTRYPTDLLQRPLDQRSMNATVTIGGPPAPAFVAPDAAPLGTPAVAERSVSTVPGVPLLETVDLRHLSIPIAMLGLLLAALAGAGHALSPGHGKTLMAAYLIGTRGRERDAVLLGGVVTASHTAGVLLLAGVVLFAGRLLPPERLYPVLSAASGVTVLVIGFVLLIRCVRRLRSPVHGHPHDHAHDHPHPHHHAHDDSQSPDDGHAPPPGWRGLTAIGIAGGMIPSTAALLLLLGAVAAGQPAYGLALALAFGIGMALVLAGIGLALVRGRGIAARMVRRAPQVRHAEAIMPWVAAIVVMASGVVLTGQAVLRPLA